MEAQEKLETILQEAAIDNVHDKHVIYGNQYFDNQEKNRQHLS